MKVNHYKQGTEQVEEVKYAGDMNYARWMMNGIGSIVSIRSQVPSVGVEIEEFFSARRWPYITSLPIGLFLLITFK